MSSTVAAPKLDGRHWKLAVVAGMASYLDAAIIVSAGVAIAIWKSHFGLSTWQVGLISGGLTISIGVGALLGGRIADKFGRVRVFNIDILVYALGAAIVAAAPNATTLMIGLALAGLAAGADLPTSLAVISERAPAGTQGRLISFTQIMWGLGISISQLLAFALSKSGALGIRIIFIQLTVVAVATWAMRVFNASFKSLEEEAVVHRIESDPRHGATPLRTIFGSKVFLIPILATGGFYIFWGLVANTFGQFLTYFLITVGGASQSLATGIGLVGIPLGFATAIIYVRLADTKWRNPLFYFGMACQILAMVLAFLGGGVIALFVPAFLLYGLGSNFGGEPPYKVWTQESFTVNARSTVQGITIGVGRFVFAIFAFVTPAIMGASPRGLLGLLVIFDILALALGVMVIRHLNHLGIKPGATVEANDVLEEAAHLAPERA
jgi:inositol transporter-like SP family MFS transporter